jgi:hypothetical protein
MAGNGRGCYGLELNRPWPLLLADKSIRRAATSRITNAQLNCLLIEQIRNGVLVLKTSWFLRFANPRAPPHTILPPCEIPTAMPGSFSPTARASEASIWRMVLVGSFMAGRLWKTGVRKSKLAYWRAFWGKSGLRWLWRLGF